MSCAEKYANFVYYIFCNLERGREGGVTLTCKLLSLEHDSHNKHIVQDRHMKFCLKTLNEKAHKFLINNDPTIITIQSVMLQYLKIV